MQRSARWARRCRDRFLAGCVAPPDAGPATNPGQAQFGIVQGGLFPDLREESVDLTRRSLAFDGYAIGGLSVGEPIDEMYATSTRPARPAAGRISRGI